MHLPVAVREIRVAAHDRAVYRGRVLIATIVLLATVWMFLIADFVGPMLGQQIFAFQSWAGFSFVCIAFFASIDSISREKREGTLGLLFLTHLKGRDIVLGKLVSVMALFTNGAVAALPILTLPILLGGIRASQSFHLLVALLTTLFFSASVGLFASSISVKKQKAGSIAGLIVLLFCVVTPVVVFSLRRKFVYLEVAYVLQFFTPFYMQQLASGALIGPPLAHFWICFSVVFALACMFVAATSFITPRIWQQRAKEPLIKRLTERYAAWTLRTINSRSTLGRRLLDRNAYEWLAARELSAATKAWTFIIAIALLAAALILNFIRHNDTAGVLITVLVPAAYILQMNIKMRIGGHASDHFAADRESNALELLLCTPLSVREMVVGEFHALRRHYLFPLITVIALFFVALRLSSGGVDRLAELFYNQGDPSFHQHAFSVVLIAIYFLALEAVALAWAGAWCGLSSKRIQQARSNTMTMVLAIPFIIFIAAIPIVLENAMIRDFVYRGGFRLAMLIIITFFTSWDLLVIYVSRRWLREKARQRLTDPETHSRADRSFFVFSKPKLDSKAPLNLGNATEAR